MRIGIDIMGGDYAPLQTTLGAIEAKKELADGIELVLLGDKAAIEAIMKDNGANPADYTIVNTTEVIGMADQATKAIAQKPNSSIAVGFGMLKEGRLDAFASAGNTGAMLVGAMFSVKAIDGVSRPALTTIVPQENGELAVLLDIGANADCKPEVLQQFAVLGSLMAENVYHISKPKVGLLNIGEEEEKGNILTQAAHQLMKTTPEINFIGNIEGRDLFNGSAHVIVCDGFTGNIVLKLSESFYTMARKTGIKDSYFDRFNYENYGGTPILGINSNVVIGHGISNAKAIKNMILLSREVTESKLSEKIKDIFKAVTTN